MGLQGATKHPFRRVDAKRAARSLQSRGVALRNEYVDCCLVQGSDCGSSAPESVLRLAIFLTWHAISVHVLLPESIAHDTTLAALREQCTWKTFYCAGSLHDLVDSASPRCVVVVSHDPRFVTIRRDARSIRWGHESIKSFDPQASRCSTPLFACATGPLGHLPGFRAQARPYLPMFDVGEVPVTYTPGPIRILAAGDMLNPRSNFKAFQILAEKFSTVQFLWHGATRNKHWGNLQLCTKDVPLSSLLATADVLIWCADGATCPKEIFHALWHGVHVMLFEKSFKFNLPPLASDVDGVPLLAISSGAPQHAPMHTLSKNPKLPCDVAKARQYVNEVVGLPPIALLTEIDRRLETPALRRYLDDRGRSDSDPVSPPVGTGGTSEDSGQSLEGCGPQRLEDGGADGCISEREDGGL